jgi:hypothetical protein
MQFWSLTLTLIIFTYMRQTLNLGEGMLTKLRSSGLRSKKNSELFWGRTEHICQAATWAVRQRQTALHLHINCPHFELNDFIHMNLLRNKKDMGVKCSMRGIVQISVGELEGKVTLGRSKHRWRTILACVLLPFVLSFAGSNPVEGYKNPQHNFLRRGSKADGPMS